MPELESLKMKLLLKQLRADILSIEEARNARLLKQAGADVQEIYKLHVSAKNSFVAVEHYLKALYKSYNYAAAITKDALAKKILISVSADKLDECFEVMINCCDEIIKMLDKKK